MLVQYLKYGICIYPFCSEIRRQFKCGVIVLHETSVIVKALKVKHTYSPKQVINPYLRFLIFYEIHKEGNDSNNECIVIPPSLISERVVLSYVEFILLFI